MKLGIFLFLIEIKKLGFSKNNKDFFIDKYRKRKLY